MSRDEVLDVIARWHDAFERRDLVTYAGLYAENATLESPLAGSVSGREAVTRVTRTLLSAFPDSHFTPEPAIVDDNRATVVSAVTGHHVGEFMGLPPSGKPFQFLLVFNLEFRDGLIARDRRIYDFTGFLVQLGVLKAKPA
jgi:steroid delta-isomerase-like uncharacterized protein